MKVSNILKHRVYLFFLSFIFVVFVVVISIVSIQNSDFVKQDVQFDNNDLQISYKYDDNNSFVPLSFEQGKVQNHGDIVEIVNKSDLSTVFSVCVQQVDVSSDNLSTNKLYYFVEGNGGVLGSTDGCIYKGKLEKDEKLELNVKIWPGSDLIDNTDQGKKISLKYVVK